MIRTVAALAAFFLILAVAACAGAYVAGDVGPSHARSDHAAPTGA